MATFDKSAAAFPGRDRQVFLLACGASLLPAVALERMVGAAHDQAESGGLVFGRYDETLDRFHRTRVAAEGQQPSRERVGTTHFELPAVLASHDRPA